MAIQNLPCSLPCKKASERQLQGTPVRQEVLTERRAEFGEPRVRIAEISSDTRGGTSNGGATSMGYRSQSHGDAATHTCGRRSHRRRPRRRVGESGEVRAVTEGHAHRTNLTDG